MLDLSFHGDAEECDEVHDEDWPEDGDVEGVDESATEGDEGGLGGGVPELELGQPPDERPELVVLLGGQGHPLLLFRLGRLVLSHRRVDLGRQEGQQKVQVVNGQSVRHNVPSLFQHDPEHEGSEQKDSKDPTGDGVWCPPIQPHLVSLSDAFEEGGYERRLWPEDVFSCVFHHLSTPNLPVATFQVNNLTAPPLKRAESLAVAITSALTIITPGG